ncbi:hypothetical protein IF1G_02093 [Cordyceps javanica]|uniref:Uncharacterized protein n=1 Tax=Cordyceps javanica TaxID=43265 RepID=A0A545VDT9_9HYPO|nr:hypothetical protein IF1G_02093 [Cordyceps javanica]
MLSPVLSRGNCRPVLCKHPACGRFHLMVAMPCHLTRPRCISQAWSLTSLLLVLYAESRFQLPVLCDPLVAIGCPACSHPVCSRTSGCPICLVDHPMHATLSLSSWGLCYPLVSRYQVQPKYSQIRKKGTRCLSGMLMRKKASANVLDDSQGSASKMKERIICNSKKQTYPPTLDFYLLSKSS